MKRFLITGASGFIGSHLVRLLVRERCRVVAVTRDKKRMKAMTGVEVLEGDFADPALLDSAGDLDAVIHLAATGDRDETILRETNVDRAAALARWAAGKQITHFLHASSIEAQGPGSATGGALDAPDPCAPVSAYGRSKLDGEIAVQQALEGAGVRLVVARIGNVYGPGSPGFVRPMLDGALSNAPLARAFHELGAVQVQPIFVEDLVRLIWLGSQSDLTGMYYFVGSQEMSVRDWFDSVIALLDAKLPPSGDADHDHELIRYYRSGGERLSRVYRGDPLYDCLGTLPRFDILRGTAAALAAYRPTT